MPDMKAAVIYQPGGPEVVEMRSPFMVNMWKMQSKSSPVELNLDGLGVSEPHRQ
jgi:hypothetical protein